MCCPLFKKLFSDDQSQNVDFEPEGFCQGRFFTTITENRLVLFLNVIIVVGILLCCSKHFPKEPAMVVGGVGGGILLLIDGCYLYRRYLEREDVIFKTFLEKVGVNTGDSRLIWNQLEVKIGEVTIKYSASSRSLHVTDPTETGSYAVTEADIRNEADPATALRTRVISLQDIPNQRS